MSENDPHLQVEGGNFTRIVNPLIEGLIKVPFRGCELAVALFIIRKTYGFKKTEDEISLSQFEKALGRSKQTIVTALKNLKLVNIARLVKKGSSKKQSNVWAINKYIKEWELGKTARLVKRKRGTSLTKAKKLVKTARHTKETTKEKTIAARAAEGPFSLEEAIRKMEEDKRRDMNIIALYFRERKPDLRTREQARTAVRRHLRAAKELKDFSDDQILRGVRKAKDMTSEWTLETVGKVLTK